jgi:riboflavin kinase/FMN adenylyltransferase
MRIIHGVKNLKIKKPIAATIGIFDGIHRGHKRLLGQLKKRAKSIRGKSCVLTFDPHPAKVLRPRKTPPMLISTKHKLNLLAAEGIDIAVLINFTKGFANINPTRFVKEMLVKKTSVKELLVGERFSFGRNKSGNVERLRKLGGRFGFKVHSISPLKAGKKIISSTLIRKLIMSGRLNEAKKLLGRNISILGTVTKGARRGRTLGFPTANLNLHHEAIPPSGVYVVKVRLKNRKYRGILNIGFRPTFSGTTCEKEPTAEVHIFGFNKSIYEKDIEVIFLKRIRGERKFKNKDHLLSRINKDIAIAKKYWEKNIGDGSHADLRPVPRLNSDLSP